MCSICNSFPCIPRCPNYESPKAKYYCKICKEGIYPYEQYIINWNEEYAHWDCIEGCSELMDFLGCEIKRMNENN